MLLWKKTDRPVQMINIYARCCGDKYMFIITSFKSSKHTTNTFCGCSEEVTCLFSGNSKFRMTNHKQITQLPVTACTHSFIIVHQKCGYHTHSFTVWYVMVVEQFGQHHDNRFDLIVIHDLCPASLEIRRCLHVSVFYSL